MSSLTAPCIPASLSRGHLTACRVASWSASKRWRTNARSMHHGARSGADRRRADASSKLRTQAEHAVAPPLRAASSARIDSPILEKMPPRPRDPTRHRQPVRDLRDERTAHPMPPTSAEGISHRCLSGNRALHQRHRYNARPLTKTSSRQWNFTAPRESDAIGPHPDRERGIATSRDPLQLHVFLRSRSRIAAPGSARLASH